MIEIPYRCLVPQGVEQILVAGRCISADHEAHARSRNMPACMATGQARGLAAAIAVEEGVPVRRVPVAKVQAALRELGMRCMPRKCAPDRRRWHSAAGESQ